MHPYTQSRTEIKQRNKEALIKALDSPNFKASIEMTDEDCVEEAICHHIIESLPTEDGGVEARCRNCNRTPTMEELEDWNEDEAIRVSDNKSYFERV